MLSLSALGMCVPIMDLRSARSQLHYSSSWWRMTQMLDRLSFVHRYQYV